MVAHPSCSEGKLALSLLLLVGTFTFPCSEPAQCLPTSAWGLHSMQPGFCWSFCKRRAEGASLHLKGDTEVKVSCGTQCHALPVPSRLFMYDWGNFWGGLSFLRCSWTGKEQKEQLFESEPPKLVSDVELQSRRSRTLRGCGHECYCGAQGRKQKGTLCSVQVFEQSWDITPWSASRGGAGLPWLLPWRCKKVTEQSKRQVRKKWAKAERNSKIYHIGSVSVFFFPLELGGNEETEQNVPFKNRSQTPRRFQGNSWCHLIAKATRAFPLQKLKWELSFKNGCEVLLKGEPACKTCSLHQVWSFHVSFLIGDCFSCLKFMGL